MADFNLTSNRFPEGASVAAYPVSGWLNSVPITSAAPVGSATDTATVTGGVAAFTGLTRDEPYVAYYLDGSTHVYVGFVAGADENVTLSSLNDALSVVENTVVTDTYILTADDAGKAVEVNAATAKDVTVPPNADVDFPVGTVIEVCQIGAGVVTLDPGSGVTLRSPGGLLDLADQYSTASLRKRGTNEWVVSGDLG